MQFSKVALPVSAPTSQGGEARPWAPVMVLNALRDERSPSGVFQVTLL